MQVIGFLNPTSLDTNADRMRAFHRGLKDTGYVEGENVTILYRWAENQINQLPESRRSGSPARRRDCHAPSSRFGVGGQSGHHDDPYRFRQW